MNDIGFDWPEEHAREDWEALPRATDPAARESLGRMLGYLRLNAGSADPPPFSRELAELARRLESSTWPTQREVLSTTLEWNESEHAFVDWMRESYHSLARTAGEALARARHTDAGPGGAAGTIAALALAQYGNAIKWDGIAEAGRDAVSLVEVKRAFAMAEGAGLADERHVVPHGDRDATATLEALFIRALLLDAVCRGNLGPRPLEVIDSWLWEWAGEYRLADTPDGPVLAYDEEGARGLRTTRDKSRARPGRRYVSIEPLERQIGAVVRSFREGRIFPGYGCAAEFRVEEHTAALDFLRFFHDAAVNHVTRQARVRCEERAEALAGLAEILAKAFVPRTPGAARHGPRPAGAQPPGIDRMYEIPRRWMRVFDRSQDGMGVEYEEDMNRPIEIGMPVTIHAEDDPRPVLCEVMRREPGKGHRTRLGLRVLSHDPVKILLARPGEEHGIDAIYLAGPDTSGHQDALLVAEADFTVRDRFEVRFDDRSFVIRMNRVRHHGRGWFLAGFEVDEERKGARKTR